jgi:hypothetical protein
MPGLLRGTVMERPVRCWIADLRRARLALNIECKKAQGGSVMNAVEIHDHARKLHSAQGSKALAEAAQMVRRYEKTGDERSAEDWRRIELALQQLQGPRVS